MVDMTGDPERPEFTGGVRIKKDETGDPNPDTHLGAKQIRRQEYAAQSDATRDFDQSRWGRVIPSDESGSVNEPSD